MQDFSRKLTRQILWALALGILFGSILNFMSDVAWVQNWLVDGVLRLVGRIFVSSLMMLVVPLVFVSLVCGVAAMKDLKKLGRISAKALGLFMCTTAVAITMALAMGHLFKPGVGFEATTETTAVTVNQAPGVIDTLINIVPTNPFHSLANGNMLQVIFFAILLGLALTSTGAHGKRITSLFEDLNEIVMKLVMMLMVIAPYGVFSLLSRVFAEQGFSAIVPMAKYFFLVLLVLIMQVLITHSFLLRFVANLNPLQFARRFKEVVVFAFSTSSSNATLPVTLEVVEHKIGVKNDIASFVIPLGATINMDGTAIMQGVATAFIAQYSGIDIGLSGYLMVVFTATLASIGTAGVPGVGLITLAMVLNQVGLPVEAIALIMGIDRLLDMVRTAVNVTGDAVISSVVAVSENEFDHQIFNQKN